MEEIGLRDLGLHPGELWELTPREFQLLQEHWVKSEERAYLLSKLTGWLGGLAYASIKTGHGPELHRSLFPPQVEDPLTGSTRAATKIDTYLAFVEELKAKGLPGPWDEPGWSLEEAWGGLGRSPLSSLSLGGRDG